MGSVLFWLPFSITSHLSCLGDSFSRSLEDLDEPTSYKNSSVTEFPSLLIKWYVVHCAATVRLILEKSSLLDAARESGVLVFGRGFANCYHLYQWKEISGCCGMFTCLKLAYFCKACAAGAMHHRT